MSSTLSSPTETVASPFSRDATIDAGAGEPRSRRPPPRLGLRTVPTAPARDASQQSPLLSLPSARPFSASDIDGDGSPGFHAELALLESLRMDVRRNLSLRPLRNSPLQQPPPPQPPFHQPARPNPPPLVISDRQQVSPPRSSGHAVAAAVALGSSSSTSSPSLSVSSSSTLSSPCGLTPFHSPRKAPSADDAGDLPGGGYSPFSHSSGAPVLPSSINETTHSPRKALIMPPPDNINPHARATRPCALDPPQLYNILCAPSPQPHLILDTRPSASFLKRHIQHSINLDLGSLISRHGSRNPLESIMALRDFIAYGLQYWDTLMATTPRRRWDGDVILIDDNMTVEPTKSAPDKNHGGASYSLNSPVPREVARSDDASSTAWTFLTMLLPLTRGQVYFPQGGSSALSTALYAQLVRGSTVAAAAIRSGSEGSGSPGVDPSSKGTITASEKEDPEKVISRPPPRGAFTTRPSELSAIKTQAKPTTKDAAAANQRGMDTVSSSSRPAVAPVAPAQPNITSGTGSPDPVPLSSSSVPIIAPPSPRKLKGNTGLFKLRTDMVSNRSRTMPAIEAEPPTASPIVETPSSARPGAYLKSQPLLAHPQTQSQTSTEQGPPLKAHLPFSALYDSSPLPSPSAAAVPRSAARHLSAPRLRRLKTSSTELLRPPSGLSNANLSGPPTGPPKLQIRTLPTKSLTLAIPGGTSGMGPSSSILPPPRSPSHFAFDNARSPTTPREGYFTPMTSFQPGRSASSPSIPSRPYHEDDNDPPQTPLSPHSRSHSHQDVTFPSMMSDSPTSTDSEEMHEFSISTILPGFLFLGPEITAPEHVDQLRAVGVKRILNVAIECDPDDSGLGLRDRFDRYLKIPMRDIVEEENVAKCVKEVCEFLDDARLHSSPTYVHCKAGKSRSVTAVIAYLIHANHWPLSRAYAFVLDRRKGICPNIGFVSELMTFEEQKLGGKSGGVTGFPPRGATPTPMTHSQTQPAMQSRLDCDGDMAMNSSPGLLPHSKSTSAIPTPVAGAATPPGAPGYTSTLGGRRPSHIRESLPPMLPGHQHVPLEGHDADDVALGSAQEVEVRDSSGRYRHARRAPVDEETLQPMRRVSKAGLESSSWL